MHRLLSPFILSLAAGVLTACSSGTVTTTPPVATDVSSDSGTTGTDGTTGMDATTGTDGADGTDGTTGADGVDGSDGTTGVPIERQEQFDIPAGEDLVCEGDPLTKEEQNPNGWPFTGAQVTPPTGKTYDFTCTTCPGGTNGAEGRYRFFHSDRPDLPSTDEYRETLELQGNAFINVRWFKDDQGKEHKVLAKGYFFCPQSGALSDINFTDYFNTVWIYTSVVASSDEFGLKTGHSDPCFLGVAASGGGAKDIFIDCNTDWDAKGSTETHGQFCRIGETVYGVDCVEPFEERLEF